MIPSHKATTDRPPESTQLLLRQGEKRPRVHIYHLPIDGRGYTTAYATLRILENDWDEGMVD